MIKLQSSMNYILKRGLIRYCQSVQKANIRNFNVGQFPQAAQYSRPFNFSKLDSGITVATQQMPASKISTISVFIKCGSRNQTQATSGTAHFLEHLHFKGTKNRARQQLQLEVQNMGGNLNAYTSRQNTCYMMTVFKNDLERAVNIIGDMITNSLYRKPDVENQRSTIYRQLLETQKSQPLQTTIEISHKGVYKNHQMGLPILGSIQNIQTISQDMIIDYHKTNYVGENILVIGAGPIQHENLVDFVNKHIKVHAKSTKPFVFNKPTFQPGVSYLQSHLTNQVNLALINQAPSFFENEFFAYLLLQRIISDRPDNEFELEIMKNSTSFKFQKSLAPYDFIDKQKGFYSSYWDTGLYGNYFLCDPTKIKQVINLTLEGYANYANKITDQELQRAKRRVYVQILQHQTQNDITQAIANNIMYYNRRVCTKQLSQRVSCVDAQQLQNVAKKIVMNANNMHISLWGNVKKVKFLQEMMA